MCEECNGHASQLDCPVCSDEINVTPDDEITRADVVIVLVTNGRTYGVTAYVDGGERDVDLEDLSEELQDELIREEDE